MQIDRELIFGLVRDRMLAFIENREWDELGAHHIFEVAIPENLWAYASVWVSGNVTRIPATYLQPEEEYGRVEAEVEEIEVCTATDFPVVTYYHPDGLKAGTEV